MADVTLIDPVTKTGAKVDNNQRFWVGSVNEEEKDHACNSSLGQKYNINTGDITLTDATETTLLYIQNTGDDDLVITSLIYNLGNTASGTGDVKIEVMRSEKAMTGDIVTDAQDCEVGPDVSANQNFGSTNTLTGKFYKGDTSDGATSGGSVTISTRSAANTGRIVIALGAMILPKNSSLAVDYTPPTSNTSQTVQAAASCYVRTSKVAVS
jgi:hypothetical protein